MRSKRARRALRLLTGAALLTGFGLAAHPVHAALPTYTTVFLTVNTTNDDPAATCGTPGSPPATPPHVSGPCSLRGVSIFADSAGSAGHYYNITASVPAHTYLIDPGNGPITFTDPYTKTHLNGGGEYTTIVDGQNGTELFYNNGSNLTIQQMTLQHGNGAGGPSGDGGALASNNSAATALTDTLVQNNSAAGNTGGGLYLSDNVASLTRVIVRYNEAQYGGGIYANSGASNYFQITVNNNFACETFTAPSTCGGNGQGGGLYADADIAIHGGVFTNNVAGSLADLTGEGGAIYNQFEMYLVNGRLTNNVAGNAGGGYYSAANEYDSIQTTNIQGNHAGNQGGGLWVSTVFFSNTNVIQNNLAGIAPTSTTTGNSGQGGGIYITGGNEEQFSGTTFTSNQALTESGLATGTCGGEGGAMYNASYVSMGSSHFYFNIACDGGAIFDDTTTNSAGYLALTNTAISQNTARVQGGGIYSDYTGQPARIAIDASGITANTASDAGGIYDSNDPSSYLESGASFVLGNSATAPGGCRNIGDVPCI